VFSYHNPHTTAGATLSRSYLGHTGEESCSDGHPSYEQGSNLRPQYHVAQGCQTTEESLQLPPAHARDDANLRTGNRAPLISNFKREVYLFQTALAIPSLYCLRLASSAPDNVQAWRLSCSYTRDSQALNLDFCRAIADPWSRAHHEHDWLLGSCRYPSFWRWFGEKHAAPHLPRFAKFHLSLSSCLGTYLIRLTAVMLRFHNQAEHCRWVHALL